MESLSRFRLIVVFFRIRFRSWRCINSFGDGRDEFWVCYGQGLGMRNRSGVSFHCSGDIGHKVLPLVSFLAIQSPLLHLRIHLFDLVANVHGSVFFKVK